jgi:hypothetical protein
MVNSAIVVEFTAILHDPITVLFAHRTRPEMIW